MAGRDGYMMLPDLLPAPDVFEVEPLAGDYGAAWGALASRSTRARYVAEAIGEAERAEVPCILYDLRQDY